MMTRNESFHESMPIMKQLTLRGFGDDLLKHLEKVAREEGISLNKVVLRLLSKGAELGPPDPLSDRVGNTLDHLIGSWTADQEQEFLAATEAFDGVDENMWK